MNHLHSQLIDSLGGPSAVGEKVNAAPNRVCNWRHRGIPWPMRFEIAEMAKEMGVDIPQGFFKQAPKKTKLWDEG